MLIEIVGVIHLSFAIIASFYGFLFKKSWIDYLFIFYVLGIILSWTFYNGECLFTYYFKKKEDPNYIPGEDSNDMKDMFTIIPNPFIANGIMAIKLFFHLLSEFIVLSRNKFPILLCYLLPGIHLFYNLCLYMFTNVYKNNTFLWIQDIIKIIIILYILYTIRKIIKQTS
jgi:hypothetical protein